MSAPELPKRPLPAPEDAAVFAREMVPSARWTTIKIESGTTEDGGGGIILRDCDDCWIISYTIEGEERMWVDKATGVVVKMMLDD